MPFKTLTFLLVLFTCISQITIAQSLKYSEWDQTLMDAREIKDSIALKKFLNTKTQHVKDSTNTILYNALMAEYYMKALDKQDSKIVKLYDKAIELAKKSNQTGLLIWVETQTGFYYYKHNQYEKALSFFNQSTRDLENQTLLVVPEKASVYKKNAYFFQTIKDYQKSISLLKEAIKWCQTTCTEYNSILFSLGCVYILSDQYDQAEHVLNQSKEVALLNNDKLQYAKATGELGVMYYKMGSYQLSKEHLLEDIEISKALGEKRNLMYAQIQLAQVYLSINNASKAKNELQNALHYAKSKDYLKGYEYDIYKLLLQIAQQENDSLKEISIRRHLDSLDLQLYETESEHKVNQLKWQAENEQIKWQLNTNNSKLDKARNSFWYTAIGLFAIITMFIFYYIFNRKKQKQTLLQFDEKLASFYKDKATVENQLSQTKQSLDSYKDYLSQKNLQIDKLLKELRKLKTLSSSSEDIQKHKSGIEELLNSHLMTDENWENFKKTFISEKQIVYKAIKVELPNLTESNLRMVMLHVLGLNNTQTANTLGITNDAVKKSKQRMRKKYGENFDTLLDQFQKLENQSN